MTRVPMGSNVMGRGEGPLPPRLQERYNIVPQGISAELIAETWGLKREELDGFSAGSHEKAGRAIAEGRFTREIVAVTLPDGSVFDTDEGGPGAREPGQDGLADAVLQAGRRGDRGQLLADLRWRRSAHVHVARARDRARRPAPRACGRDSPGGR